MSEAERTLIVFAMETIRMSAFMAARRMSDGDTVAVMEMLSNIRDASLEVKKILKEG